MMRTLRPLLALMLPQWKMLSIGIFALMVTTACMLTLPRYLQQIFDAALVSKDLSALHNVMLIAFGVSLILVVGMFCRTFFIQYSASCMISNFRRKALNHILALDLNAFESRGSGEIISRLLSDITSIRSFVQVSLPNLLRGLLLSIGTIIALFLLNTKLTISLFAFVVPVALLGGYLGKYWRGYSKNIQENAAQLSKRIEEVISAIRTVKTHAKETDEQHRADFFITKSLKIAKKLIISWAGFSAFNIFIGFIAVLTVLYLGGKEVILGNMTIGSMMAYLLYLSFLGDGLSNVMNFWPALNTALGSTERVFELLEEKPNITESSTPAPLPPLTTNGRAINLENVSFHYASRPEKAALDNINLHVQAGETVAIVGPSGAGKTTLFSLLLRLYEVDAGEISIDGTSIKNLSFKELRNTLATVSQDSHIFSTTIAANISYAQKHATEADIINAAKQANAHDFITALPNGYQTEVGEKGVRLSGGQKQRISIARAILQDAPILLLDEATSHLDAASEKEVQSAIEAIQKQRTVLVVAHRLATVKNADRIVLFNNGKIEAEGTHTQLLKKSDLYKTLATLQFLDT